MSRGGTASVQIHIRVDGRGFGAAARKNEEGEETMDLGFKGKVALVTGTASQIGMGKAIALTLGKEGCDIISCDIDLEGAKKTAAEVKALGRKAIAVKADVANSAEVKDMVKVALKEFGKIDILVNTAGLTAGRGPLPQTKEEDWQKDIAVNLFGPMNCAKAVLPGMLERKYGKIINFSSRVGRSGAANDPSYPAAKGGVISFTKSIAWEVGGSGINVNCIAPGSTSTNFGGPRTPEREANLAAIIGRLKTTYALQRQTTVEETANTAAFLASDVSSGITGDTIMLGGGYMA